MMSRKIFLSIIMCLFLASTAFAADSLQGKLLTKPDGATQVAKHATSSDASVVTIHTVTAEKTFYLNAASLYSGSGSAYSAHLAVVDSTDTEYYLIFTQSNGTAATKNDTISFPVPIEIPAGWKIKVQTTAQGATAYAFIHGWEE